MSASPSPSPSSASPSPSSSLYPPLSPSVSSSLSLPDFDLHYELHLPSVAPRGRVLLIMGMLTDGSAWRYQVPSLVADGYACCTYDNRGVGLSGTPGFAKALSYSSSNMAVDALSLLNHIGWTTPTHIIGVSMGGMIALELALLMTPSRIASMTLIVTHAGGRGGIAPWAGMTTMLRSMFTKSDAVRMKCLFKMLYTDESLKDPVLKAHLVEHHRQRLLTRIPPKLPAVLGHSMLVYRHYVSNHNLLRIRFAHFPTLVVVGEEDMLVRMSNSRVLSHALGSKLVVVKNGGHGLLAEYPEVLNAELKQFINGAEKSGDKREDGEDANVPVGARELPSSAAAIESELDDATSCSAPYTLEHQALSLTCSHSIACSAHNFTGFLGGFIPGFIYRFIFFDSIALSAAAPVSRFEQSIRFGLVLGMLRASFRAIRCIYNAYRARQWVNKYKLGSKRNNADERIVVVGAEKKGLPVGVGFDVPLHSILLLITFAVIAYSKQLL